MAKQTARRRYRAQLCWSCLNACGGCSWSQKTGQGGDFIPVAGWTARQVAWRPHDRSDAAQYTYEITACPQYRADPRTERPPEEQPKATGIRAVNPETGEERFYPSVLTMGKDGFRKGRVLAVLEGAQKTHLGWRFERWTKGG